MPLDGPVGTLTDLITIARCQEEWLLLCEDVSTVVRELEKNYSYGGRSFYKKEAAVFDVLNGNDEDDALADKVLQPEPTAVYHNDDVWALGGTAAAASRRPHHLTCRRWTN